MMMPANFSAIAENELTYVVGGSAVTDFAKTLNTNLVTIVGNSYVEKLVNATLGVMFGGVWSSDHSMADAFSATVFGKVGGKDMNGFNKFLQTVGLGAAVYQLGTASTGALNSSKIKFEDEDGKKRQHFLGTDGVFSKKYFYKYGWTE